ncbi:MAG: hypothetical protein MK089_05070 [Phycisphaerales bacterium]|nr:hypothetical protein [Phycisphaerales bacterium]
MQKWIISAVVCVMLAGCTPHFESDLSSLERSFQDQQSAVARNNGTAFIRSLEKMPGLMKRTMRAVDQMPVADQMAAAQRFAAVGDEGEKLYYSSEFRRFMDVELQSSGEAARVKAVFSDLKALDLNGWMASKRASPE